MERLTPGEGETFPELDLMRDSLNSTYWTMNNKTIRFCHSGTDLKIESGLEGRVGILFFLCAPHSGELKIFQKNRMHPMASTLIKTQRVKAAFNEIFFVTVLERGDLILARTSERQRVVFSVPMIYKIIPADQRKYIFVISVDTLGASHMDTYGYPEETTPGITQFSRQGVVFDNAYSNSSWTVAAHMSLFSSLLEHQHQTGFMAFNDIPGSGCNEPSKMAVFSLPREKPFLVEDLAEQFICVAFTGGINVSAKFGFYRGFDLYWENHNDELNPRSPEILFRQAEKFLNKYMFPSGFFFLHTYKVHTPYEPESDFSSGSKRKKFDFNVDLGGKKGIFMKMGNSQVREIMSLYDAEIKSFDFRFSRFIHFLQKNNIFEGAMIVLLSDHGEEFLEHGSWTHGTNLYDSQIKIPLIIKFPGNQNRGKRIKAFVSLVDVMPTILDYYNLTIPPGLVGASALPFLENNRISNRVIVASMVFSKPIYAIPGKIAVIDSGYKLIYNDSWLNEFKEYFLFPPPEPPEFELYDLSKDRFEKHNLYKESIQVKANLLRYMLQIRREMKTINWGDAIQKRNIPAVELIEKVRSMGYIN